MIKTFKFSNCFCKIIKTIEIRRWRNSRKVKCAALLPPRMSFVPPSYVLKILYKTCQGGIRTRDLLIKISIPVM